MSLAILSAKFTAPADATIRFTRSGSVDWTITAGDTWANVIDLVAEWSAVIGAASLGSLSLTVDKDAHTLTVTPSGSGWSITWSQSGDGTAIRDALGATGSTTSTSFPGHVPGAYPARYGAVRAHRSRTGHPRGHRISLDGSQQTQHGWAPGDVDEMDLDVQLWTGQPTGSNTYATHERIAETLDSVWDITGHSEPLTLDLTGEAEDLSDTDRWVLRFSEDVLRVRPERIPESTTDRAWAIGLGPFRCEAAPW